MHTHIYIYIYIYVYVYMYMVWMEGGAQGRGNGVERRAGRPPGPNPKHYT